MRKTLTYKLTADAKDFTSAVQTAEKGSKKFQQTNQVAGSTSSKALAKVENRLVSMHKRQSAVNAAMSGLRAGVMALGAVSATGAVAIGRMASEMDQAGKSAKKLGLTTQALTSLRHAVEQTSELTAGQFDMALQRMTRRLSEAAQGTGEAQDAIKELGLDAQQLSAMAPDEAFKLIADRMRDIDTQGDRVRLAFKLFDSEGAGLVTTLQKGSEEIERLQQQAVDLGVAFDDEAAASAEKFNDELDVLKKTFKGAMTIMADESGVISWLSREFQELNEDIKTFRMESVAMESPINQLSASIHDMRTRAHELKKEINKGPSIFGRSTMDIEKMRNELKTLEAQIETSTNKMQKLVDAREGGRKYQSMLDDQTGVFGEDPFKERPVASTKADPDKKDAKNNGGNWSSMLDDQTSGFGDDPFATPSATGDWGGMLDDQTGEFDQAAERAKSQIQTLESVYAEGLDRERAFRDERLAIVQNALDQEAVSTERAAQLKNQIERDFHESQIATASEGFGMVANLMKTNSKEMFEIGKKAAIVQTTIDTYQMATSAFKAMAGIPIIGPFLGAAAAASAVAYGMAQVSAISSQSFTPSAEGGYDIPSGVNPVTQLHEKEMVLPKEQAEVIRQLSSGGGGGAKVVVHNYGGQQVDTRMNQGVIEIIINKAAQRADSMIAGGIVNGTSSVGAAVEKTYGVSR